MFRHRGKARTFQHNLRLAVFLSFVAGVVNICGVLALGVLTTNVTGHFAYFAESVSKGDELFGVHFLLYIVAFLAGSFVSSLLTEYFIAREHKAPHTLSIFLEILILSVMGFSGDYLINHGFDKRVLAIARTTHLTGLFTDLGIELSQLFFYNEEAQRSRLLHSIKLRLGIIAFFFAGCAIGGFLFFPFRLKTLLLAAFIMILALLYDNMLLRLYKIRKYFKGEGS